MSFEVGVVGSFTARHHLVGDFGPASADHGHTYAVEASVVGGTLKADGTLFDITVLQKAMDATLADLHDRDLNTIDGLVSPNPTAEVVARFFFNRIAPALSQQGLTELRTRVWESKDAFGGYSDALT